MIGAKYCRESLVTTDDGESEEDNESIDYCQPATKSCGNFGPIINGSIHRKKRSVTGIRNSKKSVRRSAALLVNNNGISNARHEASRHKFACCERCVNSGSRLQQRERCSRINVQQSGGSISRGGTEMRLSRTTSSNSSFLTYSRRTKNLSNCRSENGRRKFPRLGKVSSVKEKKKEREEPEEESMKSRNCRYCSPNCGSNLKNFKPKLLTSKSRIVPPKIPCNINRRSDHHRVLTIGSSSDDEDVDYQVPIEYSKSCESGTRTLIPTSSHITVRICSADSNSNLNCNHCNDYSPCSLDSESSLNHLEDRVGRGLRAMCSRCCCSDAPREKDFLESGKTDSCNGIPKSCVLKSIRKIKIDERTSPRFERKTSCCCNKCKKILFNSLKKSDSDLDGSIKWKRKFLRESYEDVSTPEYEKVSFKKVLRKRRVSNNQLNKKLKECVNASESTSPSRRFDNKSYKLRDKIPQLIMNKKSNERKLIRKKIIDSPIILSAPEYRHFLNRCQRIRDSIRNMMREEGTTKFLANRTVDTDFSISQSSSPKNESKFFTPMFNDLRPNFPPMEHWSQYGDRMRDVANEYKRLRQYLDEINCKKGKQISNCSSECSSILNRMKKIEKKSNEEEEEISLPQQKLNKNNQRCCDCLKLSNENLLDNIKSKEDRSVWFDKIKEEKETCCKDCNKDVNNIKESCATMRSREADLVKTLETFCEKIKRVKSEFDKPLTTRRVTKECSPRIMNNGRCQSWCRRTKKKEKGCGKFKAKKLLIFPPEGENGPPLTLFKNSSSVNCRVKGDTKIGFHYNVTYVQHFVSSSWYPSGKENNLSSSVDSG